MLLLAFQVLINIGVASAVIPVTGMALPFISAGGSSMIVLFGMMGPILNISRYVEVDSKK
jgi:cell division protein FtsW